MSIDTLVGRLLLWSIDTPSQMQPVVLENKRSDSQKEND